MMTIDELRDKVNQWDSENLNGQAVADSRYNFMLAQIEHHAKTEWRVYLPADHPNYNSSYLDRLAAWIGNLDSENDQKLLLEYALHINFFSHDDFAALYRTALNREISPWVATLIGARLDKHGATGYDRDVAHFIHNKTWFCPVTDSMDINEFYKVNHLQGIGHRPGFATLRMLAKDTTTQNPGIADSVREYMANTSLDPHAPDPPLECVVLLEDIVGSGEQCLEAVEWAVATVNKPVLFVPLILCPNGAEALSAVVKNSAGALTVRPVVELRRCDVLGPERQGHASWLIAEAIEDLATRCAGRLEIKDDHVFGYSKTGCSLTTFANTPDNSLPLIHRKSIGGPWEPLFPRVFRN